MAMLHPQAPTPPTSSFSAPSPKSSSSATTTASTSTANAIPLIFDDDTARLLDQLHSAWAAGAPLADYAAIRDAILRQRVHLDTRILTLAAVAQLAWPNVLHTDPQWSELLSLASDATPHTDRDASEAHGHARKRKYNEANRVRNLAIVAALWSPSLVAHYGWDASSQVHMNLLRSCATRYPRFHRDFRPRLNRVLLERHRRALTDARRKTLNEAPLQPHRDLDLAVLADAVPDPALEAQWTTSQDGGVPADAAGSLLCHLRPAHFRMYLLCYDRYGLLVGRGNDTFPPPFSSDSSPLILASASTSSQGSRSRSISPVEELQCSLAHIDAPKSTSPPPSPLSPTFGSTFPLQHSSHLTSPSAPICTQTHDEARAYEQFVLGAGFDFDANIPVNLPGLKTSSWRRTELQGCSETNSTISAPSPTSPSNARASPSSSSSCPSRPPRQPPRPNKRSSSRGDLTITSDPTIPGRVMTFEESLHARYHDPICAYTNFVAKEAQRPGASEQDLSRAEWLSPDTKWASVWVHPGAQLPAGRAGSCDEADITVIRSTDLLTALQRGHVFCKPIIVKEVFSDSGLHCLDSFSQLLRRTLADTQLDLCRLDSERSRSVSVQQVVKCMRKNDRGNGHGCCLRLRDIAHAHQPLLTMLPRFRLLDSLIERIRGADLCSPATVSITSWARFNTLSLQGDFSGAQLNTTGGVWMRNLSGIQFCTMMPDNSFDISCWDNRSFGGSKNGMLRGNLRFFILEQDDVLLIPPGSCIPHALHAPTDVLSDGGVLWDSMNLIQTLNAIYRMLRERSDRDNDAFQQLPSLMAELEVLVEHHPDEFTGQRSKSDFVIAFRQAMSRFRDLGCAYPENSEQQHCTCNMQEVFLGSSIVT